MINQQCHCGHDKATHYEEKHTCLGMLCDCSRYTHRDDPLPKVTLIYPKIIGFVDCDDAVDTPRIPSCPSFCRCIDCLLAAGAP